MKGMGRSSENFGPTVDPLLSLGLSQGIKKKKKKKEKDKKKKI